MTEMEKLWQWLQVRNIDSELFYDGKGRFGRNQIIVNGNKGRKWSFICHYGSYGYTLGLIEMWDYESEPIGNLTAEQCIEKLEALL